MKRRLTVFFILLSFLLINSRSGFATHIRAGEITYKRLSALSYEFTFVQYVKTSSGVPRDQLNIKWGDNTRGAIPLVDTKLGVGEDTEKRTYRTTHTYTGAGEFTVSVSDENRDQNTLNINGGNSVNIAFYVETVVSIDPFIGYNESPVLLQPPIDKGAVNVVFTHNPGAYDPDGDILRYRLVKCRDSLGVIPSFVFPAASHFITIDSITGTLTWDSPVAVGKYNIAISIEEWRNGVQIGHVIRDMQIVIEPNSNTPPVLKMKDTCVVAGSLLQLELSATDSNSDSISLTVNGGPLALSGNPATFAITQRNPQEVKGILTWLPQCSEIQEEPYIVVVKATDHVSPNEGKPSSVLGAIRIYVIEPAPQNIVLLPSGNTIRVTWDKSICPRTTGYKLYRKSSSGGYTPGHCETGLPASSGFQLIKTLNGLNNTTFVDNNNGQGLSRGINYCYRVVAKYPRIKVDSLPDNVESIVSVESCIDLKRDLPVIIQTSVHSTSKTNGGVLLRWVKPDSIALDTLLNLPPYSYKLYRGNGYNAANPVLVYSSPQANTFSALSPETAYLDSVPVSSSLPHLNTKQNPYSYYVEFLSNSNTLGRSDITSSTFLKLTPSDNKIKLTWTKNVPWNTRIYYIYRGTSDTGPFTLLDSTKQNSYVDQGLANGVKHWYLLLSADSFSTDGLPKPNYNYSQAADTAAIDNEAPCAPNLSIVPDCEHYRNYLSWKDLNLTCSDDVLKYVLYHKGNVEDSQVYEPIDSVSVPNLAFYYENNGLYRSIAGCYQLVAVDSVGNRSAPSNQVCADNCPNYVIPKVFTPNGDNINDFLNPFPGYRFVESIHIQIFNRWGDLMFETRDININWDGRNQKNGEACSDGVYFYVCDVKEIRLDGYTSRRLKDFVQLFRGGK